MKKLFILLFIFLISLSSVFADTIFEDTFESGSLDTNNWINSGLSDDPWYIYSNNPYAGFNHARAGDTDGGSAIISTNIDTTGYKNIQFSFYAQTNGLDPVDYFYPEWFDGTDWHLLMDGEDIDSYTLFSYSLPINAEDNPDFEIRFQCYGTATTERCDIDNVLVTGDIIQVNDTIDPITSGTFNYTIQQKSNNLFSIKINANYDNQGQLEPVNRTLVPSTENGYEYGITSGLYEAHFKNLPSTTSSILIRRGIELAYDPNGLYWDSTTDDDIIDANPNGAGDPAINDSSTFIYPDAYGTGIDLQYTYKATELKELIIIDSRSSLGTPASTVLAGDNITLKHEFALHNTNNADIYLDDQLWTEEGAKIANEIKFKYQGNTIFKLNKPYAYDSNGSKVYGWYTFRRTLNSLWIEQHIPYNWVNNATYPIYIDPTTTLDEYGNLFINLTNDNVSPFTKINLYNVSGEGELLLDNNITQNHNSDMIYAIDPTNLSFSYGKTYIDEAKGDLVLKCLDWNIETETCGVCNEYENNTCVDYNETWVYVDDVEPGNSYDFQFDDVDPAYAEFSLSDGESTTTSSTYQNKINKIITIPEQGDYILMWSAQVAGSSTSSSVYVRSTFDGTTIMEQLHEPKDTTNYEDYPDFFSFDVQTLSPGNYTMTLDYRSEVSGTVSNIKNARAAVININDTDYVYSEDLGSYNTGTSFNTFLSANVNPSVTQEYFVLVNGKLANPNTNGRTNYARLLFEGSEIDKFQAEYKDGTDEMTFMFQTVQNLTTGTTWNFDLQAKDEGSDLEIEDMRIIAIPMDDLWDLNYAEETAQSTLGSGRATRTTLNFIPEYSGRYLAVAKANIYTAGGGSTGAIFLTHNGTDVCEMAKEQKELGLTNDGDWHELMCVYPFNGSGTFTVDWELRDSASVTIENAKITIFSLEDNLFFGECQPQLNTDWIISNNETCDNVERTTGTGQVYITNTGSLRLINNANITTNIFPSIERNTLQPWKIQVERGSNIIIKR